MLATQTTATPKNIHDGARGELKQFWTQLSEPLRPFLKDVTDNLAGQVDAFEPEVAEFARYALENQGKQLRPLLVGLSAQATGSLRFEHVRIAVIIEMIHLATLVHDDIMDHADVRRSRPTLASRWGNEVAVMLGDCLFAHALKLAAEFPTVDVCRLVSESTRTVCSGEIIQNFRKDELKGAKERYFKVIGMKTAELFALACDQGAFHNNSSPKTRSQLRQFGISFGTAYQIFDDVIDLFGKETAAGKSLGTDLETGKLTLPIIHILESHSEESPASTLARIYNNFIDGMALVHQLADKYNTIDHCLGAIHQRLDKAEDCLFNAGINSPENPMHQLNQFLIKLTHTYFPK